MANMTQPVYQFGNNWGLFVDMDAMIDSNTKSWNQHSNKYVVKLQTIKEGEEEKGLETFEATYDDSVGELVAKYLSVTIMGFVIILILIM